jgi:hypothetical protein
MGDGSSKTLQKTFCKNDHVEKFLQKIRPKIQNRFFLDLFYHVFGRLSVRRVKKHDKKIQGATKKFSFESDVYLADSH